MTVEEPGAEENLKEQISIVGCCIDKVNQVIFEASTKEQENGTFREQQQKGS